MIYRLFRLLFALAALWLVGLWVYIYAIQTMDSYAGEADAIVVLTGGEARVETGLLLLANNKAKRLLISGVHQQVTVPEILALYKQDSALARKIDMDSAAQDTLGNADETAAWVGRNGFRSIIIVTAHYHMPRALVHIGAQLPDVAIHAYPVVTDLFARPWVFNKQAWRLLVQDYTKFLLTYPQIYLLDQMRG